MISKIFFTAGYSNKLLKYRKPHYIKNIQIQSNLNSIISIIKLIENYEINCFSDLIQNKIVFNYINNENKNHIKKFKRNFLDYKRSLKELILLYQKLDLSYLDKDMSLIIKNKFSNKEDIVIFHCSGRNGLTIEDEEFFLKLSNDINKLNNKLNIVHIWLNMPYEPKSLDEISNSFLKTIKNIIYIKSYPLNKVILSGFSLGGMVSFKILEKIKFDKFFENKKFLCYINIASFSSIPQVLQKLKSNKINYILHCKILNSLGSFISKDINYSNNWEFDIKKKLELINDLSYKNYICSLENDELIDYECSNYNKLQSGKCFLYKKMNIEKINQNISLINLLNNEETGINHENCRLYFFEYILEDVYNKKNIFNISKNLYKLSKKIIDNFQKKSIFIKIRNSFLD